MIQEATPGLVLVCIIVSPNLCNDTAVNSLWEIELLYILSFFRSGNSNKYYINACS